MKFRFVLALFAAAAFVGGCEKKEEGGADGAKSAAAEGKKEGGGAGVKECDEYFAALEKCDKMPEAAKQAAQQGAKAMKDALNQPGVTDEMKKSTAEGCKSAMAGIKAACP